MLELLVGFQSTVDGHLDSQHTIGMFLQLKHKEDMHRGGNRQPTKGRTELMGEVEQKRQQSEI